MVSEMISFGAGVNSVAMTIMLVNDGWRGPIVFADTGGEQPETLCHMRYFEDEWLRPRGLEITRLSPETHPELYNDKRVRALIELEAFCLHRGIIPLLSSRWCSVMWKRTPLDNWRERQGIPVTCQGMCANEPQRIRKDDPTVRYPLYDDDITRKECQRIIQRAGLEVPIKSGCFFCPGQPLPSWRRLYYDHPDLYERACLIEDNAKDKGQKWWTIDSHGISMREHARRRWEGQMQMDLSQWLPCLCKL